MHQVFACLPCLEKHHGVRLVLSSFWAEPSWFACKHCRTNIMCFDTLCAIQARQSSGQSTRSNALNLECRGPMFCQQRDLQSPGVPQLNIQKASVKDTRSVPACSVQSYSGPSWSGEQMQVLVWTFRMVCHDCWILRFADDILVFAKTAVERTWGLVRDLVRARAYRAPPAVRRAAMFRWPRRWWSILPVAVQQAVAGTALGCAWPAASPTCAADATPLERVLDCPSADALAEVAGRVRTEWDFPWNRKGPRKEPHVC